MDNARKCLYALLLLQVIGALVLINWATNLQLPNASDLELAKGLILSERQASYAIAVNRTRNVAESFSGAILLIGADLFLTAALAAMALSGFPRRKSVAPG